MIQGGDRGFLFRSLGTALLVMSAWRLAGAGGVLAGGDQLLANRQEMISLAPWILLGLFFLRGPLPAKKSAPRVVGFQFLNLGFLLAAVLYGLAAVPVKTSPLPGEEKEPVTVESEWLVRDRIREINLKMEEIERESGEAAPARETAGGAASRGEPAPAARGADGKTAAGARAFDGGTQSPGQGL